MIGLVGIYTSKNSNCNSLWSHEGQHRAHTVLKVMNSMNLKVEITLLYKGKNIEQETINISITRIIVCLQKINGFIYAFIFKIRQVFWNRFTIT